MTNQNAKLKSEKGYVIQEYVQPQKAQKN